MQLDPRAEVFCFSCGASWMQDGPTLVCGEICQCTAERWSLFVKKPSAREKHIYHLSLSNNYVLIGKECNVQYAPVFEIYWVVV